MLNDINGELVNLYRVVQAHPEELIRQFRWALATRYTPGGGSGKEAKELLIFSYDPGVLAQGGISLPVVQ